ncbi:MAG: hypothetical protein ACREQE_00990 [Candidatus Binataceae bacterium]
MRSRTEYVMRKYTVWKSMAGMMVALALAAVIVALEFGVFKHLLH